MKKPYLLIISVLLLATAVLAFVNLDFKITLEDKVYYPNETIDLTLSVINRDSFTAKNATLTLFLEKRTYTYELGDLKAYDTFTKQITLPEFPPSTHTMKGVLNYTGIFDERFTLETYNSFEVRFPEVQRFPRNVNVVSFGTPEKVFGGKSYTIPVTVRNDGDVIGNLIIELASGTDSFASESVILQPGETKTLSLTPTFKTTGVSLVETRVYAVVDGIKYLLTYSGKEIFVQEERVAKLALGNVEVVGKESIRQNDEVPIKIYLQNTGGYSASGVKGTLTSLTPEIEVVDNTIDYTLISPGDNFAPEQDNFKIKTKKAEVKQYALKLEVSYTDAEQRSVSFDVPIGVEEDFCKSDSACGDTATCVNNKCVEVTCECGFVKNRQCIKYECCSDAQCGELATCNANLNRCVEKSGCINVLNNGGSRTKADIAFVGDGYTDNGQLKEDVAKLVDYDGKFNGLMSVEPFKSNKNKFNIWMVKAGNAIRYENSKPNYGDAMSIAAQCTSADYVLVISKQHYRSYCFFGTPCFNSIGDPIDKNAGRLVLHEFGHGFAYLADEYSEEGKAKIPTEPNCAPDIATAKSWWGNLEGNEGVGYFEGCSYVKENIRPTKNSIMFRHWILEDDYYPVNERKISEVLNKYT